MIIFAYVDPGLGLLAWQAVVAACLGTLFYLKQTRNWLVEFFRKILRMGRPKQATVAKLQSPSDGPRR